MRRPATAWAIAVRTALPILRTARERGETSLGTFDRLASAQPDVKPTVFVDSSEGSEHVGVHTIGAGWYAVNIRGYATNRRWYAVDIRWYATNRRWYAVNKWW